VVRAGDSLLVAIRDTWSFERSGVRAVPGPGPAFRVEGPLLQEVLRMVAQTARLGSMLHITGESGAGKEGVARAFHAAGPAPGGPFMAVNCATIPEGMAERLLFGTKRGAYSGADADADGYVQAAHGGTLFLDEVAELSPAVQAKLLRVLETGEVLPLGASRSRRVELRFCSATHRDLRAQVAAGKLREGLFFRIASPRVAVPPLRDRIEEIPWLLHRQIGETAPGLVTHVSLVEACLLRTWPGTSASSWRRAATPRRRPWHRTARASSGSTSPRRRGQRSPRRRRRRPALQRPRHTARRSRSRWGTPQAPGRPAEPGGDRPAAQAPRG
jgi:DNA-binding NtrC family response regulator